MRFGFSDIVTAILVVVGVLGYFVEISKIKINPLSALGKLFNSELIRRMDSVDKEVSGIKTRITDIQDKQEESEIKAARMRIQRFADEMYGDVRHSKEHFDLILMDITAYNNYCDTHPGFINEKTKVAQDFLTVFLMVISFYFGTQSRKAQEEAENVKQS